ncbi:unnamed protein product [Effrenium voratum]|uniref:Uncharacterized protein n=1 Tax=Effrenium voratum TaxID=2562239 RepID=A0AA36N6U9_9DINO|nr:unnamed protein product [Effrenium voratum]
MSWAAAPQPGKAAQRLTPVTREANFCHAKSCPDPASCWRCLFLRNQEEWEASSPIQADGITIGTWLVLAGDAADAGLGCVVCNKAAMDNAFARGTVATPFLSNIKRHHASLQHQRAFKVIGFTNSQQADKDCPGLDVFKQALDHRLNKCSLRQGIGGENPCGREKLSRLQWCLAESDREITRDFIRRASAIAIAQDGRQNRLLMRFSACTPNLEIKKGILGAQEVIGETISNVVVAMERVIERFATPGWGGPCAQEMDSSLREHLRNSVTIFVADAASNEQGAGPWDAVAEIKDTMNRYIMGSNSICQKIHFSQTLQGVFSRFAVACEKNGGNARRIKHLQAAKHRFASCSLPLQRTVIYIDALISSLVWVATQRDGDDAKAAFEYLDAMSERHLILISMLADISDECSGLLRLVDTESYDLSEFPIEVESLLARLHRLINQGAIFTQGFTAYMLELLEEPRGFMAVFVQQAYEAATQTAGQYDSACNLFWLNLRWTCAPRVPISRQAVTNLQHSMFCKGPKRQRFDKPIIVAVGANLELSRGNLRRVSPEEVEHAYLFALAAAIEREEPVNLRNKIIDDYDALVRTASQRTYELMTYKAAQESAAKKMTAEELYEAWSQQVSESKSALAENVTLNFVQTAIRVYDRVLSVPNLRDMVFVMDNRLGKASPTSQMWTLAKILEKTKNPDQIAWALATMDDLMIYLGGAPRQKGLVDLWVLKMDLKDYFLGPFLGKLQLPEADTAMMARRNEKSILGTVRESTRKMVSILENFVFGVTNDGALKTALKGSCEVAEVISQVKFLSEAIEEVSITNKEESTGHPMATSSKEPGSAHEDVNQGKSLTLKDLCTAQQLETVDDEGKLDDWLTFLLNKFESFCTLVVDHDSKDDLIKVLEPTVLKKVSGPCMLLYDSKVAGEASSNPNIRLPPFQQRHFRRMLQAFTAVRGPGDQENAQEGDLKKTDLVIYMDGGRSGNDTSVSQAFVDSTGRSMNKCRQCFTICYDEESLVDRREKVRGFVNQTESMMRYTLEGLEIEKVARKHYSGTNHGTHIGPVRALPYTDKACWRMSPADKKGLYGDKGRVLTGGPCPVNEPKPALPEGLEPATWHFSSPVFLAEVLHSFKPACVFRAPDVDHLLIMECIKRKVPIISVCFTSQHADLLKAKVLKSLWDAFQNDDIPELYEVGLPPGNKLGAQVCLLFVATAHVTWKLLRTSLLNAEKIKEVKKAPRAKRKATVAVDDAETEKEKAGGDGGDDDTKQKAPAKKQNTGNSSTAEAARAALLAKLQG